MDGIPTSYATGTLGAAAVQQAQQQRRASRLLAQRLGITTPAATAGSAGGTAIEPPERGLSAAPQCAKRGAGLDLRA